MTDTERLRKAIDDVITTRPTTRRELTVMFCRAIVEEFGLTREAKEEFDAQYHVGHALTVMYAILDVAEGK